MADYAANREVLAARSRQMAEQKAAYRRKLAAAEAAAARETAEAARAREIERLRQEQARQTAIERIRQEQARGAEMDRIRRLAAEQAARASSATSQAEMDQARREYALKIEALILENFVFPETVPATTRCVVAITVLKDGTLRIDTIETPSGNRIFDRAALSAITKTGTVPAPPFGREIPLGVNFGRKEIR
jgi:colicin import membrane protein